MARSQADWLQAALVRAEWACWTLRRLIEQPASELRTVDMFEAESELEAAYQHVLDAKQTEAA